MATKVQTCFMDEIRKFIIQGIDWETTVEVNVSKYSHLPPACANTQIREEAAMLGLEVFKKKTDDLSSLAILLGVWEKIPEIDSLNKFYSPLNHFGCFPLEKSVFLTSKRDVWIGRVAPYAVTKKSLLSENSVEKPHQLFP